MVTNAFNRVLGALTATLLACALALFLGACSSGPDSPKSHGGSAPTTRAPEPAGTTPSPIATMVCAQLAQRELAAALGLTATVSKPTWVDHRYSCRYAYKDGAFSLSVKELSSWPQTLAYYQGIGRQLGSHTIAGLGQGAFQADNGSVIVRKDWKVLVVDVTDLPPHFGVPPTTAGAIGVTVADVILGCWAGD